MAFTARDPHVHATKRKYLNAGFSSRALAAFEDRMSENVRNLKKAFLGQMTSDGTAKVDFCVWCEYLWPRSD